MLKNANPEAYSACLEASSIHDFMAAHAPFTADTVNSFSEYQSTFSQIRTRVFQFKFPYTLCLRLYYRGKYGKLHRPAIHICEIHLLYEINELFHIFTYACS